MTDSATPPDLRRHLIVAHRGGMLEVPENTLLAFRHAQQVGCDGVELDVRLTADNRAVVHHDPTTARIDPARSRSIGSMRLQEVAALDVGRLAGLRYSHEFPPPLIVALRRYARGMLYLVELKAGEDNRRLLSAVLGDVEASGLPAAVIPQRPTATGSQPFLPECADERGGYQPGVAFVSMDPAMHLLLRERAPKFPRVAMINNRPLPFEHTPPTAEALIATDPAIVILERKLADRALVTSLQAAGRWVLTYSVRTVADVPRMLESGCDGFMVACPRAVIEAHRKGANATPPQA